MPRTLKARYGRVLEPALRRPRVLIGGAIVAVAAAAYEVVKRGRNGRGPGRRRDAGPGATARRRVP